VNRFRLKVAAAVAVAAVLGLATVASAHGGGRKFDETLTGYEETPALSTPGVGEFRARINRQTSEIQYTLTYSGLESNATQAHIHFENPTNSGSIVVFLCTNVGGGPAGTQACPAAGGTISGTITAADVGSGAAMQGIAAGEFEEFVNAIRAGATYVNVHSTGRPAGEIRAQLEGDHSHHH
jgi:CHRD domain-containing protein